MSVNPSGSSVLSQVRNQAYGTPTYNTAAGVQGSNQWIGNLGCRVTDRLHAGIYARARHVSVEDRRFTTRVRMPQLLQGENPYAYANSNPCTFVDPDGQLPWKALGCAVACAGSVGCIGGLWYACRQWRGAYDSFADCAYDFLSSLPPLSLIGCAGLTSGCLYCLAKAGLDLFGGDCSAGKRAAWDTTIHALCDLPSSCDPRNKNFPSPPTQEAICAFAVSRLKNGTLCLSARVARQIACYKDDTNAAGHIKAISDVATHLGGCAALYAGAGCWLPKMPVVMEQISCPLT